jgi:uncharacterized integral membrane protein
MNTSMNPVYQGQFGEFTITDDDRREVILYRTGLAIAGFNFESGGYAASIAIVDSTVLFV